MATEGFSTAVRLALSEKPIPNLPDIEALQKDVQQGHYQVDYEALADKLIELDGLWYR